MSEPTELTLRARARRVIGGLAEGVRIAFESLRTNLFRSALTILGVGIGVAVVVLMAALITGIRTSVQEGIESSGPRNLLVTRFDPTEVQLTLGPGARPRQLNRPSVTGDEAARVNALPTVRRALLSVSVGGITAEFGGTRINGVSGVAETEEWPEYRLVTFLAGRNFVESEVEDARSVIVISERMALDLFGEDDPIGQRIRVTSGPRARVPVTVIGVVRAKASLFNETGDHFAIVPYTTAVRRLGARESSGQMIVVPEPGVALDDAEDQIIALLRSLRGLAPEEENNFSVVRSTQLLDLFDRLTAVFFLVMLALSSVALLVGGIGVVGIMMISVTERTPEIGIRKALGATRREVLWQFLVEAAVLTFVGGAAGLLLGGGLAWITATLSPVPARIPAWAVAAALLMAAFTGMVFGLVPALKGARMAPVVALRQE
jgi:putative ABC transport system permease protein